MQSPAVTVGLVAEDVEVDAKGGREGLQHCTVTGVATNKYTVWIVFRRRAVAIWRVGAGELIMCNLPDGTLRFRAGLEMFARTDGSDG